MRTDEYYRCLEYFDSTQEILRDTQQWKWLALRIAFVQTSTRLGNVCRTVSRLSEPYCQSHPSDDLYVFAVTVLLTFFFEQCLIGSKVQGKASHADPHRKLT